MKSMMLAQSDSDHSHSTDSSEEGRRCPHCDKCNKKFHPYQQRTVRFSEANAGDRFGARRIDIAKKHSQSKAEVSSTLYNDKHTLQRSTVFSTLYNIGTGSPQSVLGHQIEDTTSESSEGDACQHQPRKLLSCLGGESPVKHKETAIRCISPGLRARRKQSNSPSSNRSPSGSGFRFSFLDLPDSQKFDTHLKPAGHLTALSPQDGERPSNYSVPLSTDGSVFSICNKTYCTNARDASCHCDHQFLLDNALSKTKSYQVSHKKPSETNSDGSASSHSGSSCESVVRDLIQYYQEQNSQHTAKQEVLSGQQVRKNKQRGKQNTKNTHEERLPVLISTQAQACQTAQPQTSVHKVSIGTDPLIQQKHVNVYCQTAKPEIRSCTDAQTSANGTAMDSSQYEVDQSSPMLVNEALINAIEYYKIITAEIKRKQMERRNMVVGSHISEPQFGDSANGFPVSDTYSYAVPPSNECHGLCNPADAPQFREYKILSPNNQTNAYYKRSSSEQHGDISSSQHVSTRDNEPIECSSEYDDCPETPSQCQRLHAKGISATSCGRSYLDQATNTTLETMEQAVMTELDGAISNASSLSSTIRHTYKQNNQKADVQSLSTMTTLSAASSDETLNSERGSDTARIYRWVDRQLDRISRKLNVGDRTGETSVAKSASAHTASTSESNASTTESTRKRRANEPEDIYFDDIIDPQMMPDQRHLELQEAFAGIRGPDYINTSFEQELLDQLCVKYRVNAYLDEQLASVQSETSQMSNVVKLDTSHRSPDTECEEVDLASKVISAKKYFDQIGRHDAAHSAPRPSRVSAEVEDLFVKPRSKQVVGAIGKQHKSRHSKQYMIATPRDTEVSFADTQSINRSCERKEQPVIKIISPKRPSPRKDRAHSKQRYGSGKHCEECQKTKRVKVATVRKLKSTAGKHGTRDMCEVCAASPKRKTPSPKLPPDAGYQIAVHVRSSKRTPGKHVVTHTQTDLSTGRTHTVYKNTIMSPKVKSQIVMLDS